MILPVNTSIENKNSYKPQYFKPKTPKITFKGVEKVINKQTHEHNFSFFTELVHLCLEDKTFLSRHRKIIGETLEKIMPDINAGVRANESGMRGFVSRLDDDFVAKVPHWFRKVTPQCIAEHCQRSAVIPNKFESIPDYYGHHVMRFGEIGIMKNATAPGTYVRAGRPFEVPLDKGGMDYYVNEYLETCSQLPQASFNRLANNLKRLNEIKSGRFHYEPDTENPNNFLIYNEQFRIVDDLDPVEFEKPNSIVTMLKPLITKISTEENAEFVPELVAKRNEIFKKCTIAAAQNELPLGNSFMEQAIFEQACELTGNGNKVLEIMHDIENKEFEKLAKL